MHLLAALSSPVLALLELLWVGCVTAYLVSERRPPASTLAWILALSLLPLVGIPVYMVLGPYRLRRKRLRMALARQALGRELEVLERRTAAELTPAGQLQRIGLRLDAAFPQSATGLRLLTDGDACYDALVEAIGRAARHVHLEYYIFAPDRTGARLRDALVEARRRGVEVRLLVDAAGSSALGDRFLRPLTAAGGKVARFNRILHARLGQRVANFRTHRKLVVVDGRVGFTGGMNVADDHSRAARGEAAWRDVHLRIEGQAVRGLQATFLENWLFARRRTSYRGGVERLRGYFPEAPAGPHAVQIVAAGPDQQDRAIEAFLFAAVAGARRRAWLTTPYYVPTEPLEGAIASAALRGVDVRLLVPEATDSRVVDAAGRTYHDALLRCGARLFLRRPPMLHAKTLVVDDGLAVVGTANLDARSLRLNFEVLAAVYGGPLVEELAAHFEAECAQARPKEALESGEPWGRRLAASAARLLAPQL